ncbi:hypothetical protein LZ554_008423 [Drepanopeziza brunnea f. sp. 'monogermtubi']|nr:hypothetical protein LZ554_008423 [Drepanopeziza brunnea f. sp. 'monogermtubi']
MIFAGHFSSCICVQSVLRDGASNRILLNFADRRCSSFLRAIIKGSDGGFGYRGGWPYCLTVELQTWRSLFKPSSSGFSMRKTRNQRVPSKLATHLRPLKDRWKLRNSLIARRNESTKSSFCGAKNPRDLDRLTWRGKGTPMSLVTRSREHTLDVEMGGPVALDMRDDPLPSFVQARFIPGTPSRCRSVQVVELGGQGWKV